MIALSMLPGVSKFPSRGYDLSGYWEKITHQPSTLTAHAVLGRPHMPDESERPIAGKNKIRGSVDSPLFSYKLSDFSHIVLDKGGVLNIIWQPYRNVLKIRLLRLIEWEPGKILQDKSGHFQEIPIDSGQQYIKKFG